MVSNVGKEPHPSGWLGYCTGCGVCAAVCSADAISIELTGDGFYEPQVDDARCSGCGACEAVCNRYHLAQIADPAGVTVVSAKSRDAGVLRHSSSGGVSSALMRACVEEGYVVVGVAYDIAQKRAVARVADSTRDLDQFSGSKYFQSFNVPAYRQVLRDRTTQKYAVFGTPCQIHGIARAAELRGMRERLLLVDVFCHGCPSLNLWTKYLEHVARETQCDDFDHIEFRSKVYGWHEYAFRFRTGNRVYASARVNDPFYALFFGKNAFNMACYECAARSTLTYADIRLGDFWGHHYDLDSDGVSVVILVSNAGRRAFSGVESSFEVNTHEFLEVVTSQSYGVVHTCDTRSRNRVLTALASDAPLSKIAREEHRRRPFRWRVRALLGNLLKLLPPSAYMTLKKHAHRGGL